MLKFSSSLFRNIYWLALNLPFFVGASIITVATYDLSRLNLIILIITLISLVSIFYLDNVLFKVQSKMPTKYTISDLNIRIKKQVNGQQLAIVKLVLGILITIPSMFNMNILSLILFSGITALIYFIEIGTNCRLLPIYLLALLHPCYAIASDSKSGIAYIANDDDTHSADKYVHNITTIISSDVNSGKSSINKKYNTEINFLIK